MQPHDRTQQGTLSCSVGTEQRNDFTLLDFHIGSPYCLNRAVAYGYVLKREHVGMPITRLKVYLGWEPAAKWVKDRPDSEFAPEAGRDIVTQPDGDAPAILGKSLTGFSASCDKDLRLRYFLRL